MAFFTYYDTSIGRLLLTSDGEKLTGLWTNPDIFSGNKGIEKENLPIFKQTKKWLEDYFGGKNPQISLLSLAPAGSMFQQKVWETLKNIPFGRVVTYGDIAQQIACQTTGGRMAAQAIGGAVGRNPISIIIPCHRVIGKNNNLTGYGGGLAIKVKLLQHEGIDISRLNYPKYGRFA